MALSRRAAGLPWGGNPAARGLLFLNPKQNRARQQAVLPEVGCERYRIKFRVIPLAGAYARTASGRYWPNAFAILLTTVPLESSSFSAHTNAPPKPPDTLLST